MKGFLGGLDGIESTCNEGDLSSIPDLGRSPGEGKGYLLQYSGLENSMDCIVYGVANSQTRLSDFHTHTHKIPVKSPGAYFYRKRKTHFKIYNPRDSR